MRVKEVTNQTWNDIEEIIRHGDQIGFKRKAFVNNHTGMKEDRIWMMMKDEDENEEEEKKEE